MNGQRLLATHIPVLPKGSATDFLLFSHMANHNEQQQYLKEGADALIIFQGPHAYVSASWYREKDISTWDYSAVHVNAKIRIQSREELELSLKELVAFLKRERKNRCFTMKFRPKCSLITFLLLPVSGCSQLKSKEFPSITSPIILKM